MNLSRHALLLAAALLCAACGGKVGGTLSGGEISDAQWAAALDDTRGAVVKVTSTTCSGVATGTGFVLDDRTVITNAHVVEGATALAMTTQSGTSASVEVAHADTYADLAAASTTGELPAPLPLGSDPVPGDLVRALGYPGGGPFTATSGRVIEYRDGSRYGRAGQVLAVSAKVAPGNSGGPLVNDDGLVVGVVFAIDLRDGAGLVIPVSLLSNSARGAWDPQSAVC